MFHNVQFGSDNGAFEKAPITLDVLGFTYQIYISNSDNSKYLLPYRDILINYYSEIFQMPDPAKFEYGASAASAPIYTNNSVAGFRGYNGMGEFDKSSYDQAVQMRNRIIQQNIYHNLTYFDSPYIGMDGNFDFEAFNFDLEQIKERKLNSVIKNQMQSYGIDTSFSEMIYWPYSNNYILMPGALKDYREILKKLRWDITKTELDTSMLTIKRDIAKNSMALFTKFSKNCSNLVTDEEKEVVLNYLVKLDYSLEERALEILNRVSPKCLAEESQISETRLHIPEGIKFRSPESRGSGFKLNLVSNIKPESVTNNQNSQNNQVEQKKTGIWILAGLALLLLGRK